MLLELVPLTTSGIATEIVVGSTSLIDGNNANCRISPLLNWALILLDRSRNH